jgi:hypothetical protein
VPACYASRVTVTRIAVEVLLTLVAVLLAAWALFANDVWFQVHMMSKYCVTDPGALGRAHAARWGAGVAAAILAIFVRPSLARHLARRSPSSIALATLRITAAVVLSLVVTDVVLRARGKKPPPPDVRAGAPPASRSAVVAVAGRTVHYAVNKDGIRTRTPDDVPDPAAPTIVFSGESIVFGYGLDYDETISARVSARTGLQTVNVGLNGAASDESLARLRRTLALLERPVAVVTFMVYSRLDRNAPPSSPFLGSSPLWSVLRAVVHYRGDEVIDLTRAILREGAVAARARGAHPLVVFTPRGTACITEDRDRPWIARRLAEEQPFSSIHVDIDDSLALGADIHPGPRGAEHYAIAVERALRDAGVVR